MPIVSLTKEQYAELESAPDGVEDDPVGEDFEELRDDEDDADYEDFPEH